MALRVKKLSQFAHIPTKAHPGDLGYDLYAVKNTIVKAQCVTKVPTDIAIMFPDGMGGLIRDRSSIATNILPLFVVAGVIDEGYRGEVCVALYNPLHLPIIVQEGQKIAQLILVPVSHHVVEEIDEFPDTTSRGTDGFGSTGK